MRRLRDYLNAILRRDRPPRVARTLRADDELDGCDVVLRNVEPLRDRDIDALLIERDRGQPDHPLLRLVAAYYRRREEES